jgi:transcriptional regulator with XRE-family HTH domain
MKGSVFMEEIQIINRLQEWRKKQGLTQRELSEITGIPISTIQKIEIGDREISRLGAKMLLLLSKALGVSMEQLITEEEE